MIVAKFTVDTHLFRELGELLVGRDSTALIELIKNSYDADATEVTVHGEYLDDPARGGILVTDNGTGMNSEEFEKGFLRIASRMKDQGSRRSATLKRRYVGAKGIGRLAAHKLAKILEVTSIRRYPDPQRNREVLYAKLDWDEIERFETLDSIDTDEAVYIECKPSAGTDTSGTTLLLSRLRRAWTQAERSRFFAEVQSFEAPGFLQESLPRSVLSEPLLFATPTIRDASNKNESAYSKFQVRLEGEFAAGEDYWELVAETAAWVVEIEAASGSDEVHFVIAPTERTRKGNADAVSARHSIRHPAPGEGPFFHARILVREGSLRARRDERVWASRASGVRVYMEGFRVLPYGDQRDDWLSIDADYTRRPRQLELLQELRLSSEGMDPNEALIAVPNNNYFGAVFLTHESCPTLRVLVNREGFVPDSGFDTLIRLVRIGIDLCTRARAAARYASRKQRREDRRRESRPEIGAKEGSDSYAGVEQLALPNQIRDAAQLLQEARARMNEGDASRAEAAASASLQPTR